MEENPNNIHSHSKQYNDFRDDLFANGYVVIKNAISTEKAKSYQERALSWLKSFHSELDLSKPETWVKKNLPVLSHINTVDGYGIAHEKFMWDARMEPGIIEPFAKLWGTDELLVSFDALNITFPNRKDVPRKEPWEHIDQSPFRRGLHCVQGIINLSTSGPEDGGLMVYPGSHKLTQEFFDTQTDKATWTKKDYYHYEKEQLEWFKNKGLKPLKIEADYGDLILWDSRTIHYGSEPNELGKTIRTVIYATYTPAKMASEEALKVKAEIFEKFGGTTHWPHDNIVPRFKKAILEDGTVDPQDTSEPKEKPTKTDNLLKLAGVKPY